MSPAVLYACQPDGDFGATYIGANCVHMLGYEPEVFTQKPLEANSS